MTSCLSGKMVVRPKYLKPPIASGMIVMELDVVRPCHSSIPMSLVVLHGARIYRPSHLPMIIGANRKFPKDWFGGVITIESTRTTRSAELELNSLIHSPHADAAQARVTKPGRPSSSSYWQISSTEHFPDKLHPSRTYRMAGRGTKC